MSQDDMGVGREAYEQGGGPVGMVVPADVLARRFSNYAESYRIEAEKTSWWRLWRRGLFFGAYAALKLESEALADLTAQGMEARQGGDEGSVHDSPVHAPIPASAQEGEAK